MDDTGKEIDRKIKWLDDFSNTLQSINLIFSTPETAYEAVIIYRINNEVPLKQSCEYVLLDPKQIRIDETNDPENYTVPEHYQLPRPSPLTESEEDELEKNLVWIFASARSGTSWLGMELLSYETFSINEPQIGLHLGMKQNKSRDNLVRNIEMFEDNPDYFFSNRFQNTWYYFLRKLILNRIYAQFNTTKVKIIIKEPNGSLGADLLIKCLPKSLMIFLLRDGRDVIDSSIDARRSKSWATKQYNLTPISDEKELRLVEIENMAKGWNNLMFILKSCYAHHDPKLKIKIKYEDLLQNTSSELKKIYDFIGIDISEDKLNKIIQKYSFDKISEDKKGSGKVTRSATPGKWKENFSEEEQKIMQDIMGKTLSDLGYS